MQKINNAWGLLGSYLEFFGFAQLGTIGGWHGLRLFIFIETTKKGYFISRLEVLKIHSTIQLISTFLTGESMKKNGSFQVDRMFLDDEHFPYGFARSGDFTIEQANLLEVHGWAYVELASGQRKPAGQSEIDFVAFCHGEKNAESVHEKVWKRYRDSVSTRSRRYSLAALATNGNTGESSGIAG